MHFNVVVVANPSQWGSIHYNQPSGNRGATTNSHVPTQLYALVIVKNNSKEATKLEAKSTLVNSNQLMQG